ncbi:MAG: ParB N-terminal domain-containing protein [Bryobacterales bacterium]|nr:ParB N-terminal domain-containing protein [Bryobacterales bacterium]
MSNIASFNRSLERIQEKQSRNREQVEVPNAIRPRHSMGVPIADIVVEGRLRAVDSDAATHLAESMGRQGQLVPIHVRTLDDGGFKLAAGAHRIAAAELLGWTEIEAFIIDELPEDELVLLEIDENLYRAELIPAHKSLFFARRKEVYQRLYPETGHGGDRKSLEYQDNIKWPNRPLDPDDQDSPESRAPSFVEDTAASTPWSPRTVRRYTRIGEHMDPDLLEALASTPIGHRTGDLERIADMEPEDQQQLLARLKSVEAPPKTLAALQKDPTSTPPRAGNVDRLKKLWAKSTEDERSEFREWLDLQGGE